MKILLLDIETAPNLAYVWGLWNQNVAINQIKEAGDVLCWAAKWLNEKTVHFDRGEEKLDRIWSMMDEADAIVHYNGTDFDIPHLNRQFILAGFEPPAPYKEIDLLKLVRKRFNFPSNKLEYVSRELGIGSKHKHEGFDLWVGCMMGDAEAWKTMERYNKQDVILLEKLYGLVRPWIASHPSVPLHSGVTSVKACTNCGSINLRNKGMYYTMTQAYHRWVCKDCGTYMRERFTAVSTEERRNILTQAR